ncbi:hypothetical protein R6Q57_023244 [Mikania cordata]
MRKSGGAGKKQPPDAIDEVEELLKLTEDDLLLKLTVNSHIKSKSKSKFDLDLVPESSQSNAIDPDLDRRFQALRSKPNPKTKITATDEDVDVDDLFARFAALKAPNTTPASNSTSEDMIVKEENEEDEVQKIINWAIDAARLDPSPSSDIDDGDDDNDNYEDDDDSDDDEDSPTVARKKEGSKK